jgi:hypothetical protein
MGKREGGGREEVKQYVPQSLFGVDATDCAAIL